MESDENINLQNAGEELFYFLRRRFMKPTDMIAADITFAPTGDIFQDEWLESHPEERTDYSENELNKHITLPLNYTKQELDDFMAELYKINYDSGYGIQFLYGTIWFYDGSWAERSEYDGMEWWVHRKYPLIPEKLIRDNKEERK